MSFSEIKLIVTGHKGHGKNTVSLLLPPYLNVKESSHYAAEQFMFTVMKEKYGIEYPDIETCFQDRINHRDIWYKEIRLWNGEPPIRMGQEIFKEYNVYNGMRHVEELTANRTAGTFDFLIWVDASKRLPPEERTSMSITKIMADFVINNNYPKSFLPQEVNHVWLQIQEAYRKKKSL